MDNLELSLLDAHQSESRYRWSGYSSTSSSNDQLWSQKGVTSSAPSQRIQNLLMTAARALSFAGAPIVFTYVSLVGVKLTLTGVYGYTTPPGGTASACGYPCIVNSPPSLTWTAVELTYVAVGIALTSIGAALVWISIASRDRGTEWRVLGPPKGLLRGGQFGILCGVSCIGGLVSLGSTGALPNGGGLPLFLGGGLLAVSGAVVLWRGFRASAADQGGTRSTPSG